MFRLMAGVFMMYFAIVVRGMTEQGWTTGPHRQSLEMYCGGTAVASGLFTGGGLLIFLAVVRLVRTE